MKTEKTTLEVSIGRGETILLTLPRANLLPVPERPRTPALVDSDSAIRLAVEDAFGVMAVEQELSRSDSRVCIVVPDRSRRMPVRQVVEEMIRRLRERRIASSRVSVVIATGTHPPMADDEIREHLGSGVISEYSVKNHNFRDPAGLVRTGASFELQGTTLPIVLNREVIESDVVLGVGSVRPHRAVGWSGGGKIILPGVAGEETIEQWHWLGWGFPREAICEQIENPMREFVDRVAQEAGLAAVVNFVMNWQHEPLGVYGGHYVDAQRAAAAVAVEDYRIDVDELADVLILGSPASSTTLYPSSAQLQQAPRLVKRGGTVILLAACMDGIAPGLPQVGRFGYRPVDEVRAMVAKGEITSLVAASHIMYVSEGQFGADVNCILVSRSLCEHEVEQLGLGYADTAEQAMEEAFQRHGRDCSIRVVTHMDRR